MLNQKALKSVLKKLREILTPPPNLKISEWAGAYRYMSGESSPERGKYNPKRAAYQIEIQDAFCDPKIEMVVGMLPAQFGKSTIVEHIIGYYASQDPKPILIVQPTQSFAETFSKDRLAPMIRDTPILKLMFGDTKARNSENTLTHKKFPGGYVALVGANSPMDLAGRPVPIVMLDEVDRYPLSAGAEGSPIDLAIKRASNFWNRKIGILSTPTDEHTSQVYRYYLRSDQRRYHVACPHCEHEQILEFKRLKYELDEDGKVVDGSAQYNCSNCNTLIDQQAKNKMVMNGKWVALKPTKKIAGFWANALYSPWVLWETTAQEYEDSKDNPMQYKTFVNTRLCEVSKIVGERPDWESLYARRESYKRGTVPNGGLLLYAGVDVQHDRLECEIVAYGRGLESWSVDYRVLLGNTADPEVWKDLAALLDEEFEHESGAMLKIKKMAVDASDGQRTAWVYAWARAQGVKRVMAVKGSSYRQTNRVSNPKAQDFDFQGKKYPKGVYLTIVGTEIIKHEFYSQIKMVKNNDNTYPLGFPHFPDYHEGYFKGVLSEEIRLKTLSNGSVKYEFYCPHGVRNEPLDCRVYARAAATSQMIDHFTPRHWERLRSIMLSQRVSKPRQPIVTETVEPQPRNSVGFGDRPQSPKKRTTVSRPIG